MYCIAVGLSSVTAEIWDGNGAGCGAGKDDGARVDGFQGETGYHHC